MAYQMTPSERRARALALKQQRENRNLYQQYLTQKEEYDRRVEQERLNALYEENKVKNQNFFVRAGHTIGDIAANVITGAVKGLEGIYDLGAGIVGAVGGIFDKGFQDDVKKHISYDWTMETFGNDWQEALKYSYTKNGGIVESVASGIGQMLPSVAVTIATGGAGAPAAVSQMASLATLGASAAGNATEEAFNDGAGYFAGLGYGLASGAVEIATEKMFGGATKGLFGKGMLDDVGKSIADTGIKRIAKNALEEGVEEIVSELANPLLRSMYKGGEALQDYGTGEYWAGVAKAGIVGSLTSLAYTGTVGYGLSKAGVGYAGKEADINESLAEIETQKKKAENLFANEKLTEQNESRISSNIVGNYQNIERTLKKASEAKRASLIKKFSLEKAFNPDGSIRGDFATQIGLTSNEAQVAQEGKQGTNEGLASQFKKEYYSPSLRGSEAMIQADLAAMTERLRVDEKNFATQQGREAQEIAEVKPFTGEMSDTAKKNYTSLKKGLNALNNTSGGKIRLVVVDSHDSINGSIVNDSTFYISESQLEGGAWAETLVHEYTHFAEGSKEYGKLLGFLQSDDILVEVAEGKSIPLWQKAQEAVIRNYGFDQKRLESIVERVGKNESLSPEDMVYYNAYLSELGAHESEYLLGNEAFIDKIISKDKSLAAKIIEKIRNLKSMFEKTKDTRTKQEQKLIHKAEKLWLNAVEKAGLKYVGGKIYRRREVDAKAQNEYNGEASEARLSRKDSLINHTFPTYNESAGSEANTLATRWAHRAYIEVGDRTAISYHDKWYLVEKFENSDLGYQIVAQISEKQYQEFIEERNNGIGKGQSIQKSVSVITSIDRRRDSSVGRVVSDDSVSPRNRRGDNQIQRVGEEQSQRGETQSNRSEDSEGGGQGKRGIKFSLKESEVSESALQELNKNYQEAYNEEREAQKRLDSFTEFEERKKRLMDILSDKNSTNEQISLATDEYDGIIDNSVVDKWGYNSGRMEYMEGIDEETRHYIVFKPEQIKLTTNEKPTINKDIRFSKKKTPIEEIHRTYYKLSDGQIKKLLANNTHYKVYSKVDAERIINNVLSQYMSFGEKYGEISGKSKAEVIDLLWKGLNSAEPGKQMGVALHIADYIIQNSVLESIYSDDDVQIQSAIDIVDALRPYLHSINLDSLKGEIKYRYDKDNSAYLLWGKRKGEKGIGVDTIPQILEEQGIYIDAISEADIFFEIDAQYRNAVKSLKKKAKDMLFESLSKEQVNELRQEIAREVLRGFDYTGKSSKLAEVLDKYKKQISTLYEKLRESNRHNKATNRLLDKVQKIKNWKTGAFVNSSKFRSKLFKGSIERLAMIKNRGNLNQSGTRRILAGLAEWYAKDNPILGYVDGENVGVYNQEIADILQAISQNQKALTDEQVDLISVLQEKSGISDYKGLLEWYTKANLGKGYNAEVKSLLRELASETTFTTEEIIALEKVVGYFGNLIENYNKVIRNGNYVDAKPIAKGYIETIKRNKSVKVGWFSKFFDKVFNNGKASYLQTFADPMTVARYIDKYENGFYSEMLAELRAGGIKASVLEMNIRQPLEEFLSKHKKYGRGVSQRTIKYKGAELPALDAFLLYMTMNREQALGGLAEAGFTFNNGKETIRVDGFAKGEELTLPELRERAKAEQDELYKQFTEEDREYISIAEKIFNEDCKEAKRETDILRQGYSNVFEGYYVPIRRANSAVTVDSGSFFDEMNRVSNASFNKDTVQGAKGELFIEGLDEVLDRHIHGVSQYAGLATVIDQYDILYNLNMSEDANKPITVRTESENTWGKGNDYFKKLISDLQGISPTRGGGSKLFGFFRGHYATYQLGLNPKVWFTQLSSFFASGSILDYSSILKGLSINAKDVDEYCQLAAVRNNDNSAAMAQGVMDKVDKVGSALMKPIGMVDRFVIKKLFGACQVQVEKESGLKVGTEENKKKAGELLEKVIVETQQNSMATERSAAMRSGSELMKTLTMFTADSMKVFGRVVDSLGEVSVLKAKIKETTDSKAKVALEEKLKAAKKKSVKSVAALATTAIFMALIAQAFRWLYNKDDDDENIPANMAVDAIGNLMGGLPLIKDLYAKLTEGYDLNNYSYSALNDLFDAFSGTISTVTSLAKGEDIKPLRTVKELSFAVGQILGLPTRNVYNIIYGLMKRISPSTAYEWDNNLYNKNYSTDLQKAINNDDDEMLATIVGLMLDEKVGGIDNSFAREEMDRLVKGGYQVIPKSIGRTITYEGEEVEITSKQRERFKKVYGEANKALASLVNNKSYASANDEVKAKAVRFIYDIYYNLAIEDLLGVELETKNILFAKAIDISSLAIIVATARSVEADTDKKGNIISGSRKKKVQTYINSLGLKAAQKYMIMGYLGYSNKNGQQQVKSYIQRLSLTKSEKEKLYEYSGYAA